MPVEGLVTPGRIDLTRGKGDIRMWWQKIVFITTLAFLAVATGCMNQSWQRGQEHLACGRYALALESFEEAQRKSPKLGRNSKFVADLQNVRTKNSQRIYEEALVEADAGDLSDSTRSLRQAIELNPNNADASVALRYASGNSVEESDEIERLFSKATDSMQQKRWEDTLSNLQGVLAKEPRHIRARVRLHNVRESIQTATTLFEKAEEYIAQKHLIAAAEELRRVLLVNPFHSGAQKTIESVEAKLAEFEKFCSEGKAFLAEEKYSEARESYRKAVEIAVDKSEARAGLISVCRQEAEELEGRNMPGRALLRYAKIVELSPEDNDAAAKVGEITADMRRFLQCDVGVIVEDAQGSAANAAAVESELLAHAHKNAGRICELFGRNELKVAATAPGFMAYLTVHALDVETSGTTNPRQERYQAGTTRELNPAYMKAQQDYNAAVEALNQAQAERSAKRQHEYRSTGIDKDIAALGAAFSELGVSAAELGVSSARQRLDGTPMYLEKPVYQTLHYAVTHTRRVAFGRVVLRLTETESGKTLFTDSIEKEIVEAAENEEDLKPEARTRSDLAVKIGAESSMRLERWVTQHLALDHFRAAKDLEKQKEFDEQAAEEYMLFFILAPDHKTSEVERAERAIIRIESLSPGALVSTRGESEAVDSDVPGTAEACYERGFACFKKGDWDGAIRYLSKMIELQPDVVEAYVLRGAAYWHKDDKTALQDFERAIELRPDFADAYWARGMFYWGKNNNDAAIRDFSKAIQFKPDSAKAFDGRGSAYLSKGAYELAIKDYDEVLRLEPDLADVYKARGTAYYHIASFKQAIEDYTTAIKLNPDYAKAYHGRGAAYAGQHDYHQAIRDFSKALELEPDAVDSYHGQALVHYDLGDYDQAIEGFSRAIELEPASAKYYMNRGIAYSRKGNYEQAIADCNTVVELEPDRADSYSSRGFVHLMMDNYDQAIRDLHKAVELKPDHSVYCNLGTAYVAKGDLSQAVTSYDRALAMNPEDVHAYLNKANTCVDLGRVEEAIEAYQKFLQFVSPDDSNIEHAKKKLSELEKE